MSKISLREIIYEITHISEESVPRWIAKGVSNLTPEMLETAILEWQDPLLLADYLHLENPAVKFVARTYILKPFWERVKKTLNDEPLELYNLIAKDPEKKKLLDTERGRAWLNYVRKRCYRYYYGYTWGEQFRDAAETKGNMIEAIEKKLKPK